MDKFKLWWEIQKNTQATIGMDPLLMRDAEKLNASKDLLFGLHEELTELGKTTAQYKAHILKRRAPAKVNVAEDVVDVLKYIIAIAQLHKLTPDDIDQAFIRKSRVFDDKARCERLELERDTKLLVTDLDDCIADLSDWSSKLRAATADATMNDGIVNMLETLKTDFYTGGGFLKLPTIEGAVEALTAMQTDGYKIVIITARPQWQYKRVHGDTVEWLQAHKVPYDHLFFNKDKAEAVYENLFPARPTFFVEDRDKHCLELAAIGVPVLHFRGKRPVEHKLVTPVNSWQEVYQISKDRSAP